jgi:hypothetical protein
MKDAHAVAETLSITCPSRDPVFVVGVPRSGTTLLQVLIARHSAFFTVPETHFFTTLRPALFEDGSVRPNWRAHLFEILAGKPGMEFSAEEKAHCTSLLPDAPEPWQMLEAIVSTIKQSRGLQGQRWIEKTPRHIQHIGEVHAFWPDAKIVHIYRDPRDVVSSFHSLEGAKSWWANFVDIARRAERYNECHVARMRERRGAQILDLKYESLARNTEQAMRQVMAFLGATLEADQLTAFGDEYSRAVVGKEDAHKSLVRSGSVKSREGVWQTRLDAEEVWWIERTCRPWFHRYGYSVSNVEVPISRRILLCAAYVLWRLRNFVKTALRLLVPPRLLEPGRRGPSVGRWRRRRSA